MTKYLSKAAVLWALYEAPDVPARLVSTLVAVASFAGEDGRAAFPSAATVAAATRKSETQAKRDMAKLAKLGLLTPGDQRKAAHIRADRRPKVYDLAMPRGASRRTPSNGSRGASGNRTGCSSLQNGVHPDAPEEFLKNSGKGAARAAGAAGRAAKPTPTPPGYSAPAAKSEYDPSTNEALRAAKARIRSRRRSDPTQQQREDTAS